MHTTQSSSLPATLLKQDEFPLRDNKNREIGRISAFIRLSCFGKLIVTQFQLAGGDDMNYMFKGTNPSKIFKEAENYTESQEHLTEQEIPGDIPYENVFGYPKESEEFIKSEKMGDIEEEEEELIEEDEQEAEMEQVKADEAEPKSDTKEEEEEYKEIGAEINGHSITIRVLKKRKKAKKTEVIQDDMDERVQSSCICPDPPCLCTPKLNVCDCDYPLPPELISRCTQAQRCCSCNPPPGSCCCLQKSQTQNPNTFSATKRNITDVEPGVVTMKGDQVFFQMPNRPLGEPINEKDKKTANSLYYKLGSTEGGKEIAKQYVQILPQNPGEPLNTYSNSGNANTSPALTNDQDAFLLKVKQTNNTVGTKNKLEMELKTQKPKEPKPEVNTTNTQYLSTDFPPVKKKVNENAGKHGKKKKK
ncbi:uncharacterized protein LOC142329300 [Lycorma delicatula]|uniref:uncharacterized protein LOC142329300 n=1 Tax=Lycorma delicatula TaxID=130591 RepID=UPI003F516115